MQRDALRVGALRGQERRRARVPEPALAGPEPLVQRAGHERVRQRELALADDQPGRPQRVGGRRRVLGREPGERRGEPQRHGPPEHRERAGERLGARRQPREPALDAAPDLLGAELAQPRGRGVGRLHALGEHVGEQRPQQEGVAGRHRVTGAGEPGHRGGQPLAHQRLRGVLPQRTRAQRRLGRRGEQLRQQLGLTRGLARADGAEHPERQLVEPAGELHEPAQRGRVGPVDVVDDQQRRPAGGQVGGQPDQPVERGVHRVTGERRLGCRRVERAP